MRPGKIALLVVLALLLSAAMFGVASLLGNRAESVDRQAALQPFYTPPEPLPAEPGTVIRAEPLGVEVPHGTALRILYMSQRADGSPAASGAMLFLPKELAPGGPVVAWAHGTVGQGDACAPSRSANPLQDTDNWLGQLLQLGVAVVSTDYVGLGTPGVNEYLVGAQEARDVVNSVRAARDYTDNAVGTRFVVAGHSQGGHSAIWTGHLADDIAPELSLLGVVAAAPAAYLAEITQAQWNGPVGWVIGPEVTVSWPYADPELPLDGVITPAGQKNYERLANECVMDAALEGFARTKIGQNYFTQNPTANPQWASVLDAETPDPLPADMPMLLEQGTADQVVLPYPNAKLQVEWCKAGSTLDAVWLGGIDHLKIATTAGPVMVPWVMDRFAGRPAQRTCTTPPPVPTEVPDTQSSPNG